MCWRFLGMVYNLEAWGLATLGSWSLTPSYVSQPGDHANVPRRLLWPPAVWKGNYLRRGCPGACCGLLARPHCSWSVFRAPPHGSQPHLPNPHGEWSDHTTLCPQV